ncbi:hypothetical protein IAU60_004144 [Kwoniella sp. DSM 27419]
MRLALCLLSYCLFITLAWAAPLQVPLAADADLTTLLNRESTTLDLNGPINIGIHIHLDRDDEPYISSFLRRWFGVRPSLESIDTRGFIRRDEEGRSLMTEQEALDAATWIWG